MRRRIVFGFYIIKLDVYVKEKNKTHAHTHMHTCTQCGRCPGHVHTHTHTKTHVRMYRNFVCFVSCFFFFFCTVPCALVFTLCLRHSKFDTEHVARTENDSCHLQADRRQLTDIISSLVFHRNGPCPIHRVRLSVIQQFSLSRHREREK